jgi:hypothetical protein
MIQAEAGEGSHAVLKSDQEMEVIAVQRKRTEVLPGLPFWLPVLVICFTMVFSSLVYIFGFQPFFNP